MQVTAGGVPVPNGTLGLSFLFAADGVGVLCNCPGGEPDAASGLTSKPTKFGTCSLIGGVFAPFSFPR